MTFGFNGWGEAGTGLLGLISNKPGVAPRGGKIVMVSDVDRIRPRAYVHRHKLNEKHFTKGSNHGQNEVKLIWDMLSPLCERDNQFVCPQPIFREKPHFTWDNYFCGDALMDYPANEGFGLTMTCRRDRLPAGIPNKHLQKGKKDASTRPRASRFQQPFCIKKAGNGGTI